MTWKILTEQIKEEIYYSLAIPADHRVKLKAKREVSTWTLLNK